MHVVIKEMTESMLHVCGPVLTQQKYQSFAESVRRLDTPRKRDLYQQLRKDTSTFSPNTFVPQYGLTVGEIMCFVILLEKTSRGGK